MSTHCPHYTIHTEKTSASKVINENGVDFLPDVIKSWCADCGILIKEVRLTTEAKKKELLELSK